MAVRYGVIVACFGLIFVGLLAQAAHGQRVTVQLPTFRRFSMSTTVVVPDRGGVFLGGVNRAGRHGSSFGAPLLPRWNRVRGGATAASGVSLHAWIHDFEAMDRAVRNEGQPTNKGRIPQSQRVEETLPEPPDLPEKTIGELKQIQKADKLAKQQQAIADFQAGKRAQQHGKPTVARIYYQMALRRATGDLKNQIARQLDTLFATKIAGNVNRGR